MIYDEVMSARTNPFEPGTEEYEVWEREAGSGAGLLSDLRTAIRRYVALPSAHAEVAVTLWIVATHAVTELHHAPRLAIRSPEKRCGKSRLLEVVGMLCRRPLFTANTSSAVFYRVMGGDDPRTLLIDEADAIWGTKKTAEQNEDLRGLVNAGFERGRPTLRYDAAARRVEELETYGFVALAAIGTLPDTITDRSVNILMRRRRGSERVAPYRSRRDGPPLVELRERVMWWVGDHTEAIAKAEPKMPVEDRAADVWEGLVTIADIAGGDWPKLVREAAVALTREHDEEDRAGSDGVRLLSDIRDVFRDAGQPFIGSLELVKKLRGIEDAPWADIDLTVMRLAARLRAYKVESKRNATATARGYRLEDLAEVFESYLTADGGES